MHRKLEKEEVKIDKKLFAKKRKEISNFKKRFLKEGRSKITYFDFKFSFLQFIRPTS